MKDECYQHSAEEHAWRFSIRVKWEPRDLWIGVFRDSRSGWPPQRKRHSTELHCAGVRARRIFYVCLLPCLPIIITIPGPVPTAWWATPAPPDDTKADRAGSPQGGH